MKNESVALFSLIFYICYIGVAFVLPTWRTYRRTKINPITFGNSDNAHDYIGRWFKVVIGLIPVALVGYVMGERAIQYLCPITYLQADLFQYTGITLCILSFIWTVVAQVQMGNSWRIGLDNKHKTKLIQDGLFSVSRNPIFAGMILTLFGLFLVVPNAITLLVLVCGYLLIQIQIRLEEEFLLQQHGEEYQAYKKKVNRLI